MKDRISELLKDLVSIDSITYSSRELKASKYIYEFLKGIPYFQKNPRLMGYYDIEDDPFGRKIPYGVLLGKKKDTVVSLGHYDVISTEEYGEAEGLAFSIGSELDNALSNMKLDEDSRKDMESGEWIWGRGTADMKGGLAIHLALFEHFAKQAEEGTLEGSLLFFGVPDEESYSAGGRFSAEIINKLVKEYNLNIKLLINPEPNLQTDGKQVISIGSAGKTLPVIMVQGEVAHAGHIFNGISPVAILANIFQRVSMNLDFADKYQEEASMPPSWSGFRDMKEIYDASIPYRAYGYMTIMSLTSTPEEVMNKLIKIAEDGFAEEVTKLNGIYQEYKKINKFETKEEINYQPQVLTYNQLCVRLKAQDEEAYSKFREEAYERVKNRIKKGELNLAQAAAAMMEEVLNYADMKEPVVLIGFAPPLYLPVHSDFVSGKEGMGTKVYEYIRDYSKTHFDQEVTYENFFLGMGDCSYACVSGKFDYSKYSENNPVWGSLYRMDFEKMEENAMPPVIYGPISKNYHQWTERVNKRSLLETVPEVTMNLIEYIWSL